MKCKVCPGYMERLYSFYSPFYDHVFGHLLAPGRRMPFKYLNRRPDQKILEIGVGPGSTLEFYPPRTDFVGIDICEPMIDKAREKADKVAALGGAGCRVTYPIADDIPVMLAEEAAPWSQDPFPGAASRRPRSPGGSSRPESRSCSSSSRSPSPGRRSGSAWR